MPLKAYGVLITRAVDTRREGADDTPHYHPARMRPLPPDADGPDNYLADVLDHYVRRAVDDPEARLYVFRERWGPENGAQDKVFGFRPGNGVHDIHMNQGNSRRFRGDDGVWQDGGILIHFPGQSRWVGILAHGRHHRPRPGRRRRHAPRARRSAGAGRRRAGQPQGPGACLAVPLPADGARLGNNGSEINLLDAGGLKVHGVSYTGQQGGREGWTVVF